MEEVQWRSRVWSGGQETKALEKQDQHEVVEHWAVDWSAHGNCHDPPHRAACGLGLGVAWYRDVLRAKLVSLRLPLRLLLEYKEKLTAQIEKLERQFHEQQ
ncbi:MAG TPA: hypothetical protein VMV69_10085 [Pirellulales bacterium]|nr:hypothetical protein [Pirellulales bacterium]